MQAICAIFIVVGFVLFGFAAHYGRKSFAELPDDEPMYVSPYEIPETPNSRTSGNFLGLALIAWMIAILIAVLF